MSQIEELEAHFRAARAALATFNEAVTEKYRQAIPGDGDDVVLARARAKTDQERAEWKRLDDAAREAAVALHRARDAAKTEGSGE